MRAPREGEAPAEPRISVGDNGSAGASPSLLPSAQLSHEEYHWLYETATTSTGCSSAAAAPRAASPAATATGPANSTTTASCSPSYDDSERRSHARRPLPRPDGTELLNPTEEFLLNVLLHEPARTWEGGSGDSTLQRSDAQELLMF